MEKQKQLLIQVLVKLSPYWNLANGILARIQLEQIDQKSLDVVAKMINGAIHKVKDEKLQGELSSSLALVEKIKTQEAQSKKQEDKELEEMENLFDEIDSVDG